MPCRLLIDSLLITMKNFLRMSEKEQKSYISTFIVCSNSLKNICGMAGKKKSHQAIEPICPLNPLLCFAGSRAAWRRIVGGRDAQGARCAAD